MTKKKPTKKPLVQKMIENGIKLKALNEENKRAVSQKEWAGIGKSIPYSKLPKDVRKQLDNNGKRITDRKPSNEQDPLPKDSVFTRGVCEHHLKSTGQMTDDEVSDMVSRGNWKQHIVDHNTLSKKISMEDVPFDQMMAWVTTLISDGSENKSFDDVIKKFFNFHLGQLDVESLLTVQYDIETRIKKLVMGKKQEEKVYKIG